MEKPHRFQILVAGKSLNYTDTLSQHGLGENASTIELFLEFFKAPSSTGDKKKGKHMTFLTCVDERIVQSIVQDVIASAILKGRERKWKSLYSFCNFLIESTIRDALSEIEKAEACVSGITTLDKESKGEVYRMLYRYEMEDDNLLHV